MVANLTPCFWSFRTIAIIFESLYAILRRIIECDVLYRSVFCFHMSAQKPDLYCSIRSNRDRLGFSVEIQIISDTAQMGKDIRGACGTKQRWLNNENAYASFKDFSTCPQSIN